VYGLIKYGPRKINLRFLNTTSQLLSIKTNSRALAKKEYNMKKERIVINEFEGVSNNSFELRCAIYPNVTNGKYEANDNSDLTAK
tara:strand:- start:231 stop:485 length:255 start_codon:yes stop_codon:yes gene_type:complete